MYSIIKPIVVSPLSIERLSEQDARCLFKKPEKKAPACGESKRLEF